MIFSVTNAVKNAISGGFNYIKSHPYTTAAVVTATVAFVASDVMQNTAKSLQEDYNNCKLSESQCSMNARVCIMQGGEALRAACLQKMRACMSSLNDCEPLHSAVSVSLDWYSSLLDLISRLAILGVAGVHGFNFRRV